MKFTKIDYSFFLKLLGAFLFLALSQTSTAVGRQVQNKLIKVQMLTTKKKSRELGRSSVDTSINKIEGKVVDSQTKEPLPAAIVVIKGTVIAASTDTSGNFNLGIPDNLVNRKIVLIISLVGYVRKEFPVKWKNLQSQKDFLLTK